MKIPIAVYFFLMIELLFVAFIDFKTKKISNLWVLINFSFFLLMIFIFPDQYKMQLRTFLFPAGILFFGFVLYLFKIMGAGDSKYLFSFYLLIPFSLHEPVFSYLIYSTIIVGSSIILYISVKNFSDFYFAMRTFDKNALMKMFGTKFSYAPVILMSWVWLGWAERKIIFW